MKPNELQDLIDSYSGGSYGLTRHPFNRRFIYTDGVKAVADLAGCYWLLDIVATEVAPICLKLWEDHEAGQTFLHVNVKPDASCDLILDDGNDGDYCVHWRHKIGYTDFPEGSWTFYLFIDGVIEYPKEVLVMLLPSEN